MLFLLMAPGNIHVTNENAGMDKRKKSGGEETVDKKHNTASPLAFL